MNLIRIILYLCIIINKEEYETSVKNAEQVLKGKTKELIKHLKKVMSTSAKSKHYEIALESRKKIEALTWLDERQKMQRQKKYDEDIINYYVNYQ